MLQTFEDFKKSGNEKILNSNNNWGKPKFLRLLWDIVVSRLVVHLLNMIRLNQLFLYKISYMYYVYRFSYKFDKVEYQFCRDRNIREFISWVSISFWNVQVSAFTPFHFSFTVPYNDNFLNWSTWLNRQTKMFNAWDYKRYGIRNKIPK